MRQHHDMGGLPAGPLDRSEHSYAPWEKRTHALLLLLAEPCRSVMAVDGEAKGGSKGVREAKGSDPEAFLAPYSWL